MEDDTLVTMKEMSIAQKAGKMNLSLMIQIDVLYLFVKPIVYMECAQVPTSVPVKWDGKITVYSFLIISIVLILKVKIFD